jgi:hypothetical protein
MRGSIRVDRSASQKFKELEPAAAGTTDDSSLLNGFLHNLLKNKKTDDAKMLSLQSKEANDSNMLFAFLDKMFSST